MFGEVLYDSELQIDQWKIYPCETTPWTVIKKWADEGKYVPYSDEELGVLLIWIKQRVHRVHVRCLHHRSEVIESHHRIPISVQPKIAQEFCLRRHANLTEARLAGRFADRRKFDVHADVLPANVQVRVHPHRMAVVCPQGPSVPRNVVVHISLVAVVDRILGG